MKFFWENIEQEDIAAIYITTKHWYLLSMKANVSVYIYKVISVYIYKVKEEKTLHRPTDID